MTELAARSLSLSRSGTAPLVTVTCVGNLTIDEAVSATGRHTVAAGGDALYAALAVRLVGGDPVVLAPVGTDRPAELISALTAAGTAVDQLPARPRPTVRNIVRYAPDGSRSWLLVHGEEHFEAMSVRPADLTETHLRSDAILLSAMALRAQLAVASWVRGRTPSPIYFDPQEDYISGHQDELLAAVAACDVFLPSETEATALAGTTDLEAAARSFLGHGPRLVVIKRAEQGCLVVTSDLTRTVPAEQVDAVDSTGAGDAFCGAFAAVHVATGDPVRAARAGATAAGRAVSAPGVAGLVSALAAAAAPSGTRP